VSITIQFEIFTPDGEARWLAKGIVYGGMGEEHADATGRSAARAFEECAEQVRVIVAREADKQAVVFPPDRSKAALVTLNSLLGYISMWAVRQSPYTSPAGLAEVLEKFEGMVKQFFTEGVPTLPMRTFTERQLESLLVEYLVRIDHVQKWGEPKNPSTGIAVVVTATGRPQPDDDSIDLHALVGNIARSTIAEAREQ